MRFVHISSNQTVTKLKSTALMAYLVHAILLPVSLKERPWMIDYVCTLVVFLPVCCRGDEMEEEGSGESDNISVYELTSSTTVSLKRIVHVTESLQRRERRMSVLHNL